MTTGLLSMTGQGQAIVVDAVGSAQVEIRSVNNRFLKVAVRCGDPFGEFSGRVERLVQASVRRGMLNVSVKIQASGWEGLYRLNDSVIAGYLAQLRRATEMGVGGQASGVSHQSGGVDSQLIAAVLNLPGAVQDTSLDPEQLESLWPVVDAALAEALSALNKMRAIEGQAMALDLSENLGVIESHLQQIELRAPQVSLAYQERMLERIQQLLQKARPDLSSTEGQASGPVPVDVIKEVAVFADRWDISEELVRLKSHLAQFHQLLKDRESQGRKMDFLIQEIFREINTVGSKANDADIASNVVAVKTCIERMREMVQNIE